MSSASIFACRRQRAAGSVTLSNSSCSSRSARKLFDGRRHEAGILQDPVRDANFLGNEGVVVELERRARARQIVELAARGGCADPLFD